MIASRMAKLDASGIRKVFDLAASMTNPVNLSIGQPDFGHLALHAPQPPRMDTQCSHMLGGRFLGKWFSSVRNWPISDFSCQMLYRGLIRIPG